MRRCWLLDNSGRRMPASPDTSRKEAHLVGLVLISHSGTLVNGLRDMVAQVAGDEVAVGTAGGTEDGRLGTSATQIATALRSTLDASPDGVLVLFDLGSAALSLELALEDLDPANRARIRVSEAPLAAGGALPPVNASVGWTHKQGAPAATS